MLCFTWILALHGPERFVAPPADTVFRGTMALHTWERRSVLGDATVWTLLASNKLQNAVLADGVKIAVSTDAGDSWASLPDAPSTITGLYGLNNNSLWAILDNGTLLSFASDLSSYTTIIPGGVVVNTTAGRGIAANGTALVAVAPGMNETISNDGGLSWSPWAASGTAITPVGLCFDAGNNRFVVADSGGNSANSVAGSPWTTLVVFNPFNFQTNPSAKACVELPDRVVIIGNQNNREGVWFSRAADLEYWAHAFWPYNEGYFSLAYMGEYEHDNLAPPGTSGQSALLRNNALDIDGMVTHQNIFYTPETGMVFWGQYGIFYQTHFGRYPVPPPDVTVESTRYQIYSPWFRLDPIAIRAMAPVIRSDMPCMTKISPPEYAVWLNYTY